MPLLYEDVFRSRRSMQSAYPPGAPLPRFQITRVEGYAVVGALWIDLRFEGEITNFEELANWWEIRGHPDFRTKSLDFSWTDVGSIWMYFYQGSVQHHSGGMDARIMGGYWGKWNTLAFKDLQGYGSFNPPLYFCDVYVPFASELPSGVWTDLQFRVTPTPLPNKRTVWILAGSAVVVVGLLGGYALAKRRRR